MYRLKKMGGKVWGSRHFEGIFFSFYRGGKYQDRERLKMSKERTTEDI